MSVVAVYARASIDRSERRISVDRQLERCARLASDLFPDRPVRTYCDNDLSGSKADIVRPAFEQLLADVRRGDISEVVAHEQSRLTRQPAQWDALVVALTRAGIGKVHTVQQGSIPVAPGTRLLGRVVAIVDADESERTSLRALAMHEQLAAEGRPNGGRYYGYRRAVGDDFRARLEIVDDQAKIVDRICAELAAGISANSVADGLNADGVPTGRSGKQWRAQAVLAIARRPHIAGLRTFRGQVTGEGRWEPIIGRDRWEHLQDVIGTAGGRPARARRWLLTGGIACCGRCGAQMIVGQQRRPRGYINAYICTPRSRDSDACGRVSVAPAETVEQLVVEAVLDAFDAPATISAVGRRDDPARRAATGRLAAAERRVARAAELFGAGEVDEATWRQMHVPARGALDAARRELTGLQGPDVDLPALGSLRAGWDGLTLAQCRQAVALVVRAVTVGERTGRRPADPRVRVAERLDIVWRQ